MDTLLSSIRFDLSSYKTFVEKYELRIYNALIPTAFISYAALDSGLGRICLWSYIIVVTAFFLPYRFSGRDRIKKKFWKREKSEYSRKTELIHSITLIDFVIGRILVTFVVFIACIAVAIVLLSFLYALSTGVAGLVVMSFDFLWDFEVDIHSYINRVWNALVYIPDQLSSLWHNFKNS